MHKIVNPQQTRLFDPFDGVLTEKTRKRLLAGWPGIFHHVILELMPVDAISGHFAPTMGRPTKELYSIAGLLIQELFEEEGLAKATMDEITTTLVEELGTKIDKQRLDSTHIFSDMASFGRTRLMGVAIKRFLTQVIRHNKPDYNLLDESFMNSAKCTKKKSA